MIFGSSTDVGKTIVSGGLSIAGIKAGRKVCYIKPVQTGELDEYFIRLYANPEGLSDNIFMRTIHHWTPAMAPHLAAMEDKKSRGNNERVVQDDDLVRTLSREMRAFNASMAAPSLPPAQQPKVLTVVETAGGVLSPGPSKSLQADIYRPLRLPVILVGDAKLGGITTTLCAYESLRIRGYTVLAVAMIARDGTDKYGNVAFLREHLAKVHSPLHGDASSPAWTLNRAPEVFSFGALPQGLLHSWYLENGGEFDRLYAHIGESAAGEARALAEMTEQGRKSVWWPFTQHGSLTEGDVTMIESAHGEHFRTVGAAGAVPMYDGVGSWWTQAVGHGHPSMALAIAEAAGRYGHVLFPSNLHPPVAQLSRYLLQRGPGRGWAARVFYSDDGSTGMEIAIKMALRLHYVRSGVARGELVVLTQADCYHGDTLGAMAASEPSVFNRGQHPWYSPKTVSLPVPTVGYCRGALAIDASALVSSAVVELAQSFTASSIKEVMDVESRLSSPLASAYRELLSGLVGRAVQGSAAVGALLIEPLLQGAAGFKFIDPLYQRLLVDECRARGVPVVYDEVAVGLFRLGHASTARVLGVLPDIAVYGKMLTGGYLPLAATLATEETYNAFLGSDKSQALLHGHSYTANPLACTAALESIKILQEQCPLYQRDSGTVASSFDEADIADISTLPGVKVAMGLGSALAVTLHAEGDSGYHSNAAAAVIALLREDRVYCRPLGNVIYLMPSALASAAERARLVRVLKRCLTKAFYLRSRPAANAGSTVV